MRLRRVRIPFFRIWYSTTYTVLFLGTLILLAATPADLTYQAIRNVQLPQTFAVGGATLLTAILVVLVYSTRIYTNRSVLAAIPKSYLPIAKAEVGASIRKLIVKEWNRSNIIAWDTRPRDLTHEIPDSSKLATIEQTHEKPRKRSHIQDGTVIHVSPSRPPWGIVAHNGWSSPSSPDLPGLQYWSVILELPNLIEAKAVSLAPPDPAFDIPLEQQAVGFAPIPDERVVVLLRRPPGMGIREYLARLSSIQLINPPTLGLAFLKQYERARFSTTSLSEQQFRDLMDVFGQLLAGMSELDPLALVDMLEAQGAFDSDASSYMSGSMAGSGSIRHYQTPAAASVGRYTPSMATAPSQRTKMPRAVDPATESMSDEDLSRDQEGLGELVAVPDVEYVDFAPISPARSQESMSSVIRRPVGAPD